MAIRGKTSEVLAYTAGIVDGEGYIGITRSQPKATWKSRGRSTRYEYVVMVVNTDEPLIRWLHTHFGGSIQLRATDKGHPTWLPKWHWVLSSFQAAEFCEELLPYLIVKRAQAALLIEYRWGKTTQRVGGRTGGRGAAPEEMAWRESMYLRMKELQKGQPQRLTERTPIESDGVK